VDHCLSLCQWILCFSVLSLVWLVQEYCYYVFSFDSVLLSMSIASQWLSPDSVLFMCIFVLCSLLMLSCQKLFVFCVLSLFWLVHFVYLLILFCHCALLFCVLFWYCLVYVLCSRQILPRPICLSIDSGLTMNIVILCFSRFYFISPYYSNRFVLMWMSIYL